MNTPEIHSHLDALAALPGISACALADPETGMVLFMSGGHEHMEPLVETATDYWRLYTRLQNHFDKLGPLQTCAMIHAHGMLTLAPCDTTMIMVTITHRMQIDWKAWQEEVTQIAALMG